MWTTEINVCVDIALILHIALGAGIGYFANFIRLQSIVSTRIMRSLSRVRIFFALLIFVWMKF